LRMPSPGPLTELVLADDAPQRRAALSPGGGAAWGQGPTPGLAEEAQAAPGGSAATVFPPG